MSLYFPQRTEGSGLSLFGVPEELDAAVAQRLQSLLPVLALTFMVVAVSTLLEHDGLRGRTALGAGVFCLSVWAALRRKWFPVGRAHLVAAGICLAAISYGAVSLALVTGTSVAGPASVFFLVILVSGGTFGSQVWHGIVATVAIAAWALTAAGKFPIQTMLYWLMVLLVAVLLSALTVRYRLWKFGNSRVETQTEINFQREHFEKAIAGTQDGLWYWELHSDVFHFSPAWATLLGFESSELAKHPDEWLNRVHPGYLGRLRSEMAAHLCGSEEQFRNEHRIRRKDGTYIWVLARATVVRNEAGEPIVLAGSHSDITPLIEAERRLLTDAFTDPLTGIPNRSFLMSHLERSVEEKRSRGKAAPLFAVMFLDLDRFKLINDTMGHDVGDQLLIAVAARLRNCSRPDDVTARFGGDEFVLLLRGLRDPEEAVQVGMRIQKALATPFQLGAQTVQSGGSIGIAFSGESFTTADELLRFGDLAMYQAKAQRNGQVQIFRPGMLQQSNAKDALQSELATALERNQFVLHYQPLIHMATGQIVGAEALIRWQRSPAELLLPGEFLPIAEKSELINTIGEWALRTACAQNSSWQRAGVAPVRMAVNLSASQLQQPDFAASVQRILAETQLKPEWLELELSEAVLTRSLERAPATLKALNDSGIRASIDDFGSGHASLSYLHQFQFHAMKMDRRFLTEVTTNSKAASVARGLITLAHSLNLSVVAEGVELDEQFRFLSAERCDHAQGYFTGRPVPPEEMLVLLQKNRGLLVAPGGVSIEKDLTRLNALHAGTSDVPGAAAARWAMDRKARQ